MRTPPTYTYRGLTVILSNPSRFDKQRLLTGAAGYYFNSECLQPEMNLLQVDVRTVDHKEPLLPDTKCLLVLGEPAMRRLLPQTATLSLHTQRGAPFIYNGIPVICSYFPQDCMDIIDYEGAYNELHNAQSEDTDADEATSSGKDRNKTKRKNWKFWLQRDTKKGLAIVKADGRIPQEPDHHPIIYPTLPEVRSYLLDRGTASVYIDIETDLAQNIYCIGVGRDDDSSVMVIPFHRHNLSLAYGHSTACVLGWLSRCMANHETVFHNTAFDLYVLAGKYNCYFGARCYDTMLAQHRCFPEAEKSLGHCIAQWLYLPYHKDSHILTPHNEHEERQLYTYNAKDVWTTRLVRERIDAYAARIPGLSASIAQANASIRPYLINTLMGVRYSETVRMDIVLENDKLMGQYLRLIRLLAGEAFLPSSPKQCIDYFYEKLGYPICGRTNEGAPSLNEAAMQKLKLKLVDMKITNPVIDICLAYRQLKKETGTLNFTPWREAVC